MMKRKSRRVKKSVRRSRRYRGGVTIDDLETRVSNIDKEILKINSEILNIKNTFKNVTTPSNKSASNYPDKDNNYSGFSNEDYMNYG